MESDEPETDQSGDCWTYGGVQEANPGFGPEGCCLHAPCGFPRCWAPPEFTYAFCCNEQACRPAAVAQVQEALRLAVAAPTLENASQVAHREAKDALRLLLRGNFRGLRLSDTNWYQACPCAIAYAVAVLLEPGGLTSRLAEASVSPSWFTRGIDWAEITADGWSGLFALFAQYPDHHGHWPKVDQSLSKDILHKLVKPVALKERLELEDFLREAQKQAAELAAEVESQGAGFPLFMVSMHATGMWELIWQRVEADHKARQAGRKCTSIMTQVGDEKQVRWTSCSPWEYSATADFSSPLPQVLQSKGESLSQLRRATSGLGASSVATCVLGAPRGQIETYAPLRENVLKPLQADAFVYVPFAGQATRALERQLGLLGPAVTAILALDVDGIGMQERLVEELRDDEQLMRLYKQVPGPWRAPVFGQMGSSMWGYHMQHTCKRMVEAYEEQRGRLYKWVVFARADIFWVHKHPPIDVLDEHFVYIPWGQDNSHYAHGHRKGINDRHAVVPRVRLRQYFGRWEELGSGTAWDYLRAAAADGIPINTEQYLHLHLQARQVPILRFPPVAFIVHCAEGPQCQHLYKGTTLAQRQRFAHKAKYWTEMIESRRTLVDDIHWRRKRFEAGWIWAELRPPTEPAPVSWQKASPYEGMLEPPNRTLQPVHHPWEMQGLDLACCLTRSGPASCNAWAFLQRCLCLA